MSGILKRKFSEEEGSSPCSLPPEFDDVSASDSGNSNDSVNAPTTQLMPSSILKRGKRMRVRGVSFQGVTVYYFSRRQGFTSVPTQGGSSLGMSPRHSWIRRFTLGEFAREQERSHRSMLRDHLKEERLNAIKLKLAKHGILETDEAAAALALDDIREEEIDVASAEVDEYFFLQPLSIRKRRALLRSSGVRRIDGQERHVLRTIRVSRKECGCQCRGCCRPETCACSLAGIKCQVDRMSFPCGCSKDGCGNSAGRVEFNPARVRTHFLHTLMKLELEQQQHSLYLTAGNGYHGDIPLAQSQHESDRTLMEAPSMHLDPANEIESCLQESEEEDCDDYEDEEEEDEDDEEDEEETEEDEEEESEQDEDEDRSSLLSGLSDSSTHSLAGSDLEEDDDDDDDDDEERRRWEDRENRMSRVTPSVSLPSVSLASTMAFPALPSFSEALREAEAPDLSSYYSSPSAQYYPMDSYTSASTLHTSAYSSPSNHTDPSYSTPTHTAPNYTNSGYTLSIINPSYTVLNNTVNSSMSSHTQDSLYSGAEYTDSNHALSDYTSTNHGSRHQNENHFNHYGSFSSATTASPDGSTKLCGTRNINSVPSLDSFSMIPDSYKDLSQSQVQNGHHPYLLTNGEHSTAICPVTNEKNNYPATEELKGSLKKDVQVEFQNFLNNNSQELPVENGSHVGNQDLKVDLKQQ